MRKGRIMEKARKGILVTYILFGIFIVVVWLLMVYTLLISMEVLENPFDPVIIVWLLLYPVLSVAVTCIPLVMSLFMRKRALVPVWVSCGILLPPVVVLILRLANRAPFAQMEIDSGDFLVPYILVQLVFLILYGYFLKKNW